MHTSLNATVSVRSLAVIVLMLVLFWYISIVGTISEIGTKSWFWAAPLILLPFVIATFTVVLIVSFKQSSRAHLLWFRAAIVAAASCGALVVCYLGLIGVL
jgi:hypothetical protein